MRVLRVLLYVTVTLVVALITVVALAIATEDGTRFVLLRLLPQDVSVGSVKGRLLGPLTLGQVDIAAPGANVSIRQVTVEWRPGLLIEGRLLIERIDVVGVNVVLEAERAGTSDAMSTQFVPPDQVSLPLAVELNAFVLRGLTVHTSDSAPPLQVDDIRFVASFSQSALVVQYIHVAAPDGAVDASVSVTAAGRYPVVAKIDARLQVPGLPSLVAGFDVQGDLDELLIHHTLASPYNLAADLVLTDPVGPMAIGLDLVASQVHLAQLEEALPDVVVDLRAGVEGGLEDLAVGSEFVVVYGQERIVGSLKAALRGQELVVETLSVLLQDTPSRLDVSGTVLMAESFNTTAEVTWRDLNWPPTGVPDYRGVRGRLALAGTPDSYRFDADGEFLMPGAIPMTTRVAGHGSRERVDSDVGLVLPGGKVEGVLALALLPDLVADVQLTGAGVDTAAFHPEWPGRLDFSLMGRASLPQGDVDADLQSLSVHGDLRGQPVSLTTSGSYQASVISINALDAQFGTAKLNAHGRYADTADVTLRF